MDYPNFISPSPARKKITRHSSFLFLKLYILKIVFVKKKGKKEKKKKKEWL